MKYLALLMCVCLTSCTLSFTNIDSHGTATDLIDENLTAQPKVETTISVPIKPM